MTTTDPSRPADRYGAKKTSPLANKLVVIALVVLAILAFLGVARYIKQRTDVPVSVSMTSYERQNDNLMRLWVDITRDDPSVPSYCIVTALNYEMAEVGRREVIMAPGGETATRLAVDIPTRDYPVSGGVYGCSTEIPDYMDLEHPVETF